MSKPAGRPASGATPATVVAGRAGIWFAVHSYDLDSVGPGYGEAVADALGVPRDRMFKTLVAEVDGRLTVAVVPVAARLDLKALAAAAGGKRARLADSGAAERATGYVRGGISPLGQRKRLPTIVDTTAHGFATVHVSAGRRGLELELSPGDLVRLTGAKTAPISRT
jgi:Cys-tRNA(Pro)/Cys-tRNA(Cys) deacylase